MYGVSERATAMILNAFMYEEGIVSYLIPSRLVDRHSIHRWKASIFEEEIPVSVNGLFFDGKMDETRQKNNTMKKEEHITLLSEPGSEYIGHVIPVGRNTAENIVKYIKTKLYILKETQHIKVLLNHILVLFDNCFIT